MSITSINGQNNGNQAFSLMQFTSINGRNKGNQAFSLMQYLQASMDKIK
ncbi:12352_t:CDS:1, partial [Cetraspora pellucida]